MGFLVSQHGQLGAMPPPPFLSVSPLESMRSGGAIPPPPPQKGYLSDTCAIPYENKANGCDTPACDTISKGYCAIWGGVSHWAAKAKMQFKRSLAIQGAPESGIYFVATLNEYLAPATEAWDLRKEGCPLADKMVHHLIFADDLMLIAPSPVRAKKMLIEAQEQLQKAGLDINESKIAYLTTHPPSAHHLPGTNANATGMKILRRTFALSDNTPQDMDIKAGIAWSKFNKLRHILKADTPLPHRLRIFKSCVGQALLWASETWHFTRRRLQRIRSIELAMMKTLIKCPRLPPDTPPQERFATHKAHIRSTLLTHKYEHLDRTWARRYYSWAGHLARLPRDRLAKHALLAYNLAWWRKQQNTPQGHRHTQRRGNVSRWENPLGRHHPQHENWHESAQFRDRWKLYYPTFEKRLFGNTSPHDLSQNYEHNPEDPTQGAKDISPPRIRPRRGVATPLERFTPREDPELLRDPPGRIVGRRRKDALWALQALTPKLSPLLKLPESGSKTSLGPSSTCPLYRMSDQPGEEEVMFVETDTEEELLKRKTFRNLIETTKRYLRRIQSLRCRQDTEQQQEQLQHRPREQAKQDTATDIQQEQARMQVDTDQAPPQQTTTERLKLALDDLRWPGDDQAHRAHPQRQAPQHPPLAPLAAAALPEQADQQEQKHPKQQRARTPGAARGQKGPRKGKRQRKKGQSSAVHGTNAEPSRVHETVGAKKFEGRRHDERNGSGDHKQANSRRIQERQRQRQRRRHDERNERAHDERSRNGHAKMESHRRRNAGEHDEGPDDERRIHGKRRQHDERQELPHWRSCTAGQACNATAAHDEGNRDDERKDDPHGDPNHSLLRSMGRTLVRRPDMATRCLQRKHAMD